MKWLVLPALLLLSSCMTAHVEQSGTIDPNEKTVAINQGGGEVASAVKSALRARGWQVVTYTGVTINPGAGQTFSATRGRASRYTMSIEAVFIDRAFPSLEPIYSADISIVDNKTGEEIATVTGAERPRVIAQKLMEALK